MKDEWKIIRAKATNEGRPDRKIIEGTPADYILACDLCGAETVRIGIGDDVLTISSPLRSYRIKVPKWVNIEEIISLIKGNQLSKLHEFLSHFHHEGLDLYCPECDKLYCEKHCHLVPKFEDNGFYDCTYMTCPQDHERIVDD